MPEFHDTRVSAKSAFTSHQKNLNPVIILIPIIFLDIKDTGMTDGPDNIRRVSDRYRPIADVSMTISAEYQM